MAEIEWTPKTKIGKEVAEGKITSLEEVFEKGEKIKEPEIVDMLIPDMEHEVVLIGGTPKKGGGMMRIPGRRTARMHKSGRRFSVTSLVILGNKDGYVGIGIGKGKEIRGSIEKAHQKAKMNLVPVKRGCGSWECDCEENHSIPSKTEGRSGSVKVTLLPAPRGVGLVVSDPIKKFMKLAGIEDIWSKVSGHTTTRINTIKAVMNAFKNLNKMKIDR